MPRRLLRVALILIVGGVVLWVALGVTIANVLGRVQPNAALAWWPYSAQAHARFGEQWVQDQVRTRARSNPAELARVRAEVLQAIVREPVGVVAVRTLGSLAAMGGDADGAARLFRYAETLSRRDLEVQLWMIEDRVHHNDVPGALLHYDRALRGAPDAGRVLLPILVQATTDPAIMPEIGRVLASRPQWWGAFMEQMLRTGTSAQSLAASVGALRLRPAVDIDRHFLQLSLIRLTALGDFDRAFAVYRDARGGLAGPEIYLRNGNFQREQELAPFDWQYIDQSTLAGIPQPREDRPSDRALTIIAADGRSGLVASQRLVLRPGSYRLTARVGNVAGSRLARPMIAVICDVGPPSPTPVSTIRFPDAPATGAGLEVRFVVPAGCRSQTLAISGSAEFESTTSWIDDIAVEPSA